MGLGGALNNYKDPELRIIRKERRSAGGCVRGGLAALLRISIGHVAGAWRAGKKRFLPVLLACSSAWRVALLFLRSLADSETHQQEKLAVVSG